LLILEKNFHLFFQKKIMSENDNTVQASQSLTFEALGYLANQPPIDDPGKLICFYLNKYFLEFPFI
jgi:hypothetical protein